MRPASTRNRAWCPCWPWCPRRASIFITFPKMLQMRSKNIKIRSNLYITFFNTLYTSTSCQNQKECTCLTSLGSPIQVTFFLELASEKELVNTALVGWIQTRDLSWLPPPHVNEQEDQLLHSVYTGHFWELQISRSKRFSLHGLFLSLLDVWSLHFLVLVRSPLPHVLLQVVHSLQFVNSIKAENNLIYLYRNIYSLYVLFVQKYHDIYNIFTWTSLLITLFSYIWWSSPSAMLYIYNILPSIGGVLILIRVVIIFFGYSCWHITWWRGCWQIEMFCNMNIFENTNWQKTLMQ